MGLVALIAWLITAGGGFVLLGKWITNGGTRTPHTSKFPPALIFGHFALAAIGLVVWIINLVVDQAALAWIAFVLLVPVALLGFTMFARWLPAYRSRSAVRASGPGTTAVDVPERHLPVPVVAAHGVFAVITVVTVLLAALGVGA